MAQENQNQTLDKKKAEIKVLTATLYKIWVDYDELFKLKQNPDYLLKKPRYDYRELNDELLDEARRLFSDTSDFVQLREAYDCLISVCFYFNTGNRQSSQRPGIFHQADCRRISDQNYQRKYTTGMGNDSRHHASGRIHRQHNAEISRRMRRHSG